MRRKIGVVLGVLGVLALVFGVVWVTVIWPGLARIPANLVQQVDLQGTMTLFEPEHGGPVTYDVATHRKYTAQSATGDVVYLREDIWAEDTATSREVFRDQFLLGIDRVTRQNVEGLGDGCGGGHYNFPFDVSKDKGKGGFLVVGCSRSFGCGCGCGCGCSRVCITEKWVH